MGGFSCLDQPVWICSSNPAKACGAYLLFGIGPFDALESIRLHRYTLGQGGFPRSFWLSPTISVCSGGAILSAPTWSAIYCNSDPNTG